MGKMAIRFKRPLYLGVDVDNGRPVSLKQDRFETHLHLIGPPGRGKTRLLLWIFQHLCRDPNATIVLINPKGKLARDARDWTLSHGQSKRLVWFDLSDHQFVMGYNPLWPNNRPVATQAKAVREAIRSAWGQSSFDQTPQLARLLLLSLAVSIALRGTLLDTVRLLRSGPSGARVRSVLLSGLARGEARGERDLLAFLREALAWFDSLSERRQEELGASTLARLESFVCDPVVSRVLTQQKCLNTRALIDEHKILLVNLEIKRPLCIDDVRLLGRFIVNDVLNTVFGRDPSPNEPVYLILDEAQHFATHDLCSILDMGRELGLHCVLAHQNLGQLRREDQSEYVYDSVQGCALTKLYFGGLHEKDLNEVVRDTCIEQWDSYQVKDEITTPFLDPVETRRDVVTKSESIGVTAGVAKGKSEARTCVNARGFSRSKGTSTTDSESSGSTSSSGFVTGRQFGCGSGETMLPGGELIETFNEMDGTSDSHMDSEAETHNQTHTRGTHRSKSVQHSRALGRAEAKQEVRNVGLTEGVSRSVASTPFYEYDKEYRVSSRTFVSEQEFLTRMLQKMKGQPKGHVFLKVPDKPCRFLRLPWVRTPWISERTRKAGMERVYSLPCYSHLIDPAGERLLEESVTRPMGSPQLAPVEASLDALISPRKEVLESDDENEDFAGSDKITLKRRETKRKKR
jgi:type IV secretory system conjugative DNA transfer VirD4/TraG family protein